jgi:zinc protease
MKNIKILLTAVILVVMAAPPALAEDLIDYEEFTLDNGLQVIIHEDRRAPVVAVSVWYHVGSKNEPEGKTGFAHLFEHIMFRGSENFSGNFAETLNGIGATGMNGTTSPDRTNYYETVPTPGLELALWLESDRMGHLLGAVTQQILDDERGIVKNEKRQREGQPYGKVPTRIMASLYPQGHPYHHPTIGSMDDLAAASLEDVHGWFRKYYGAANAVVVLAGDIDVATARPLMEKYFGDIPAGPPVVRLEPRIPEHKGNRHEVMIDKVAQTVLHRNWAIPALQTREKIMLDVAATILNSGKKSRLYKALVEGRELATGVSVSLQPGALASTFGISVNVKEGADLAEVENTLDEVMARFLKEGPSKKELASFRTNLETLLIREMNNISGKAHMLAHGALYAGDAGFINQDIEWTRSASRKAVRKAARAWLSEGYYQLTVVPADSSMAETDQADRHEPPVPGKTSLMPQPASMQQSAPKSAPGRENNRKMPTVNNSLVLDLPEIQETTLSNGIRLILAEMHDAPVISVSMVFDNAGVIAEQELKPGTAGLTFGLMGEGPKGRSSADYIENMERLGARIGSGAGRHNAVSSLSALKKNLGESLALWADVLRHPAYRQEDMDRWRVSALQAIENGKKNPGAVGGRILSYVLYGPEHPYTSGWNDEEIVRSLQIDDLEAFHAQWVRPDNATLFVVGDTTMPEMVEALENAFGKWVAPEAPMKNLEAIGDVPVATSSRVIMVDRPGAPQTAIFAGRLVPTTRHTDGDAFEAANNILGGGMTARIGNNLRVQKGWSYGAGSGAAPALAQRLWQVAAPVQSDKTAAAVAEIIKEIDALTGDRPATTEELSLYVRGQTLSLPGMFQNAGAVLGVIMQSDAFGWPYDRVEGRKDRLEALDLDDVNRVVREYFRPETLTWVLVGDLSQFEQEIRELGIGVVEIWNTEGKKIR